MLEEFKKFALRGNVVDLAVGIIIGAAFGKIVTSFVSDILMPTLGLALGNVDFSGLFVSLGSIKYETLAAAKLAGAPTLNYGLFLNSVIDFVIIAFAIFMVIQMMNRLIKKEEVAPSVPPVPSAEERLLAEIRDVLKAGQVERK